MISLVQAQSGLAKYVDRELVPHLTGFKKIGLAAYSALAANNAGELIVKYKDHPAVAVTHIIGNDGCEIDIDALHKAVYPQFAQRQTISIPFIGDLTLDQNDIDKLYRYMKGEMG